MSGNGPRTGGPSRARARNGAGHPAAWSAIRGAARGGEAMIPHTQIFISVARCPRAARICVTPNCASAIVLQHGTWTRWTIRTVTTEYDAWLQARKEQDKDRTNVE